MANQKLILQKIVWLGLTLSQLFYGVILYLRDLNAPSSQPPVSAPPLWLAAAGLGCLSLIIFRIKVSGVSRAGLSADGNLLQQKRDLFPIYLICWSLNESIAILGLLLGMVFMRGIGGALPFMLGGVFLNVLMFPREKEPTQAE